MTHIRISLMGDVMTGRGIDQILPHKNNPTLDESYIKDAKHYVPSNIKHFIGSPIDSPAPPSYIWGDLLTTPKYLDSDLRIANLETSITTSDDRYPKAVSYRMHPNNINVLSSSKIDYLSLATNHSMDYGSKGLTETINTLSNTDIKFGGYNLDLEPSTIIVKNSKVCIFAIGSLDSGIPLEWRSNINTIDLNSNLEISNFIDKVRSVKCDIKIVSIHWGSNWGYDIDPKHKLFAQNLIDYGEVDIVHGHSSHHFRSIEMYNQKLILYGCGDIINDYEIIGHRKEFMSDVNLVYVVDFLDSKIQNLTIIPFTIKDMRLNRITSSQQISQITDRLNDKSNIIFTNF